MLWERRGGKGKGREGRKEWGGKGEYESLALGGMDATDIQCRISEYYRPVDKVHLTLLPVERVESNVELTGRYKPTARWPLHLAVIVDRCTELAIREVVVYCFRAVNNASISITMQQH